MQINPKIATQIVNRVMKIIHYSVNVMDAHGRIIGSGDKSRLQAQHEGALLAIHDNRVVEIDKTMAKQLKGVKPGINLPIVFQENVVGVVGITGEPESVRNYGALVKMTAELIIEQAALISQMQWNNRHKEELVLQLIQGSTLNSDQILSIAEQLKIDLIRPRVAAIIKLLPHKNQALSLEHLQQLVHLLENPERDNLVGIVSLSMDEVIVLKPISLVDGKWSREQEQIRAEKLLKRVNKQGDFSVCIALGDYFPGLQGIAHSYQTAKATVEAALYYSTNETTRVFFYQDYLITILMQGLKHDGWRIDILQQPLKRLAQSDTKGVLRKTLQVFFEQNCDLTQCCNLLHIHRNTLRYRLERIEQETGFEINNLKDKILLYLALKTQR